MWCYNEQYYPHRYTHVLLRGDIVESYFKSEAEADAALEEARAAAWNEGHKLRLLYERRKHSTNTAPDPGTLVRLPEADKMYPTQAALRQAVYSRWRLFKSYRVAELTIKEGGKNNA